MGGHTQLSGIERRTIEIAGRLEPARARTLTPAGLTVREDAGGAEVEMLAFRMSGLSPHGMTWLGVDYGEVLFRLGVEWRGEPAWFVVRCALDRAVVAASAAALMRYPVKLVRRIAIEAAASGWRLSADDHEGNLLRAALEPTSEATPSPRPVRPVLVRASGKLMRVPWEETPAPHRVQAHVTVEVGVLEREALGAPVRWMSALLHEGRQHRCGVAAPT